LKPFPNWRETKRSLDRSRTHGQRE
jgi:hypothetical protein